jgi:chromosome segregation ATPase
MARSNNNATADGDAQRQVALLAKQLEESQQHKKRLAAQLMRRDETLKDLEDTCDNLRATNRKLCDEYVPIITISRSRGKQRTDKTKSVKGMVPPRRFALMPLLHVICCRWLAY